jgi:hypothetical protein
VRIGVLRIRDEAVGYMRVGGIPSFAVRPVWEVWNTLFLAPGELPALTAAFAEVLARMRTLRGR